MPHSFDNGKSVIRLYNKQGEHKLSILPCDYTSGKLNCDLALKDGTVIFCGINEDLLEQFIPISAGKCNEQFECVNGSVSMGITFSVEQSRKDTETLKYFSTFRA